MSPEEHISKMESTRQREEEREREHQAQALEAYYKNASRKQRRAMVAEVKRLVRKEARHKARTSTGPQT